MSFLVKPLPSVSPLPVCMTVLYSMTSVSSPVHDAERGETTRCGCPPPPPSSVPHHAPGPGSGSSPGLGPSAASAAAATTAAAIAVNAALPSTVALPLPAAGALWLRPAAATYTDVLSPAAALSRSVRQVLEYAATVTGWDGRALAFAATRTQQPPAVVNGSVDSSLVTAVCEKSDAARDIGGRAYVILTSRPLLFLRNVAHWSTYGAGSGGRANHSGGADTDDVGRGTSETPCAATGSLSRAMAAAAAAADAAALAAALAATLDWARTSVGDGPAGRRRLFGTRWARADTVSLWAELGVFRDGVRAPDGGAGNRHRQRDGLVVAEGNVNGGGGGESLDELVGVGERGDGGSTPPVRPRRKVRGAGTASPMSVMVDPPAGSPPPLVGGGKRRPSGRS